MAFKNSTGFLYNNSGDAVKYVSGKRESYHISETGNPGESVTAGITTDNLEVYIKPSTYTSGTTITDQSGNQIVYDLKNGVTHNTFPDRFTFDGSDDFLEAASNYSSDIVTNAATFVAWIRRDGTQSNWAGFMFDREGNSVCGMHFHEDEHTIGYHWNNSSSTWSWDSELAIPDATWCMVAVAVSSTEAKAYLYTNTSTPTSAQNTTSHSNATFKNVIIGEDPYHGRNFKGDIGHAFFYSGTLTQSQITSIYNATENTYYGVTEDNLILHLDAGNTSSYSGTGTSWNNLVSSNYNATLYEGAAFDSGDGGSISFDGSNDYAKIEDAENLGKFTGNFTIEFWWKGPSQGAYQTLLDHYEGNNRMQWAVQTANDDMRLRAPDGTFAITTSGVNANNDAWHHHAISRIGTTITYYIDSTSRGTKTNENSQIGTNGDTLDIGRYSGGGYAAEGEMAQLRIYAGKGLTATEVAFNYNNTKSTFGL